MKSILFSSMKYYTCNIKVENQSSVHWQVKPVYIISFQYQLIQTNTDQIKY